jgi:hypothetical protein
MDTISHDEIKEKLVRHHNPDESPEDQRMTMAHSIADTSGEDVIFFALSGCPPEGYGIFIQGHKRLILYTTRGMPFEQIMVDEVTAVRT